MTRLTAIAALTLLAAPVALVTAGEAKTTKSFSTKEGNVAGAPEWYAKNREGVLKASNCTITEAKDDNCYKVRSKTPLGDWNYIVKETIEADDDKFVVKYRLENKLRTNFRKCDITITLKDGSKGGLDFTMKMDWNVNSSFVPSFALRSSQSSAVNGAESYIKKQLD